ncbi:MAG: type I-C CRISPR-associated protein Cas8c/Csd1 [Synergistaceae bacterium]|jgi:CRISPR-associated protein Csd1|nr:type I-C CRISPR-associated protein Cas8c/Csd1 [Synergistaceae bacterium]
MSWIQKLHETYERINVDLTGEETAPLPIGHVSHQAHFQIILDGAGKFIDAQLVEKEDTLVPATEDSAGRTGKIPPPHPLCDKIQYVAKDYLAYGGEKSFYDAYRSLLFSWNQAFPHRKLEAVLNYVDDGHVVSDLVHKGYLYVDKDGQLLTSWPDSRDKPHVFKMAKKQGEAFIRWVVQIPGEKETHTWEDKGLIDSWKQFVPQLIQKKGICMVTGKKTLLGTKHPKGVRYNGDNAKLISSNDTSGFTYLGRFTDSEQACSIGYETSQKAHNALRWLIDRQSFHNGEQVIISWEVSGKKVPSPVLNSRQALLEDDDYSEIQLENNSGSGAGYKGDFGQIYAKRLSSKIAGYRQELGSSKDIVVMGLDSVTPGRMAITYYRELTGSEFLDHLEAWHKNFAWFQKYSKEVKFIGAPAPKEIAEAAFGRRLDAKVSKMTVNRLLPCIVDGTDRMPFPQDLVRSTRNRAVNRMGMEHWEWEKVLGIACALFNGVSKGGYQMALETKRDTRDYLYGRLLAVAERLEYIALNVAGENRDTNAARLMQRFAERPYSTWLQIEQALVPYKTRLQTRRAGFLSNMKNLLDEIHCLFKTAEVYTSDAPLSGEFLLGYHCQRRDLQLKTKSEEETNSTGSNEEGK